MSRTQLANQAADAYESYVNGNPSELNRWIGKSQLRLLLVYNHVAGNYGSNTARQFMDWIRNRRGI